MDSNNPVVKMMILLATTFTYVNVPTTVMRDEPFHKAKVVSQAVFSEQVKVLEESGDWIKIETQVDRYQGWINKQAVYQRNDEFASKNIGTIAKVKRLAAHLYEVEDTIYGPKLTLPFESRLEVVVPHEHDDQRWVKVQLPDNRQLFIQKGDVSFENKTMSISEMCDFSKFFLDLPYTYGGRSSFGYDCSGFTQMLYRQMGIFLPRDSKDQINWEGFKDISLEQLQPGDLIFFGLGKDKIRHVGLWLGEGKFIHANVLDNAPYISISDIKEPSWNGTQRNVYRAARTLKLKN